MTPDTSKFSSSLKKSLDGVGKSLQKVGAGLTVGLTAPIVAFTKGAIESAEALNTARNVSAQIIRQTGGAAKVSVKDVDALTKSLERKTAIDDKVIRQGSNILLTFKQIRNEQGKNNDIFNRANEIMLDLAAVTGQDATAAATMLGKALEDPVRGLTAMRRVGVSFTEQQEEQIKSMVAAGDQLGAQKLILAELETQYGGAAAASRDASDVIRTSWENIRERIGTALLPALDDLSERFQTITDRVEGMSDGQARLVVKIGAVAAAIGPGLAVLGTFLRAVANIGILLSPAGAVLGGLGLLAGAIAAALSNQDFREQAANMLGAIQRAFERGDYQAIGRVLKKGVETGIDAALGAAGNLAGKVVASLFGDSDVGVALARHLNQGDWGNAGRVFFYGVQQALEDVNWRQLGSTIANGLVDAIGAVVGVAGRIAAALGDVLGGVDWMAVGRSAAPALLGFVVGLVDGLLDPTVWYRALIADGRWKTTLALVAGFMFVPAKWLKPLTAALRKIPLAGRLLAWGVEGLSRFGSRVTGFLGRVFGRVGRAIGSQIDDLGPGIIRRFVGWLGLLPTRIGVWALDVQKAFFKAGGRMLDALGRGIGRGLRAVIGAFRRFTAPIVNAGSRIWSAVTRTVQTAWNLIVRFVGGRLTALRTAVTTITGRIRTTIAGWGRALGGIITRAWTAMWRTITRYLDQIRGRISTVTTAIRNGIGRFSTTLRGAWDRLWDAVAKRASNAWSAIRRGAAGFVSAVSGAFYRFRENIRGAVNRVIGFMNGLIIAWNKIMRRFGFNGLVVGTLGQVGVSSGGGGATRPGAFATGGAVMGPTGRDKVRAWLTAGEHVLTKEEVDAAGGHKAVFALRRVLLNAKGLRPEQLLQVVQRGFVRPTGGDPRFAAGGVGAGKSFAQRQHGKPYIWGGVGPSGYDCSGFQSAILNVLEGKSPNSRRFTTGTIRAGNGLKAGKGPRQGFTIGAYRGNPGHMAGTLGGVAVESGGSPSFTKYNRGVASSATHPRFNLHYHAIKAGLDWKAGIAKFVAPILNGLINRATTASGPAGIFGRLASALVKRAQTQIFTPKTLEQRTENVDTFRRGGQVGGRLDFSGADDVLARLTRGEWVMPVKAVARYGPGFMHAVQTGQWDAPGFATGGQVRDVFRRHKVPLWYGSDLSPRRRVRQLAQGDTSLRELAKQVRKLAAKLAPGWVNRKGTSKNDWRDLSRHGWRQILRDGADRLYRPSLRRKLADGSVLRSQVSRAEWGGLSKLGWRPDLLRDREVYGRGRTALHRPKGWEPGRAGLVRNLFKQYRVPLWFGSTSPPDARIDALADKLGAPKGYQAVRGTLRRLRARLARGWFTRQQVTGDDWRDLLSSGWAPVGRDFGSRIYHPSLRKRMLTGRVRRGQVTAAQWRGLKRLGWRGERRSKGLTPPRGWRLTGKPASGADRVGVVFTPDRIRRHIANAGVPAQYDLGPRTSQFDRARTVTDRLRTGKLKWSKFKADVAKMRGEVRDGWAARSEITARKWKSLQRVGWEPVANDRDERLYRPRVANAIRKGVVVDGQLPKPEWNGLRKLGWRRIADREIAMFGQRRKALFPPAAWQVTPQQLTPQTVDLRDALPTVERFATGGRVDDILARLTAGEWVMPVNAVRKYGAAFMRDVQTRRLPAFHSGGPVGLSAALRRELDGQHAMPSQPAARQVVVRNEIGGRPVSEFIVDTVRGEVRRRGGGDVQKTFGRR